VLTKKQQMCCRKSVAKNDTHFGGNLLIQMAEIDEVSHLSFLFLGDGAKGYTEPSTAW